MYCKGMVGVIYYSSILMGVVYPFGENPALTKLVEHYFMKRGA